MFAHHAEMRSDSGSDQQQAEQYRAKKRDLKYYRRLKDSEFDDESKRFVSASLLITFFTWAFVFVPALSVSVYFHFNKSAKRDLFVNHGEDVVAFSIFSLIMLLFSVCAVRCCSSPSRKKRTRNVALHITFTICAAFAMSCLCIQIDPSSVLVAIAVVVLISFVFMMIMRCCSDHSPQLVFMSMWSLLALSFIILALWITWMICIAIWGSEQTRKSSLLTTGLTGLFVLFYSIAMFHDIATITNEAQTQGVKKLDPVFFASELSIDGIYLFMNLIMLLQDN